MQKSYIHAGGAGPALGILSHLEVRISQIFFQKRLFHKFILEKFFLKTSFSQMFFQKRFFHKFFLEKNFLEKSFLEKIFLETTFSQIFFRNDFFTDFFKAFFGDIGVFGGGESIGSIIFHFWNGPRPKNLGFFDFKGVGSKSVEPKKLEFLALNCQNSSTLQVSRGGKSIGSIIFDAKMGPGPKNLECNVFVTLKS